MITSALLTRETLTVIFDGGETKMVRKGQANWDDSVAAYTVQDESRLRTAMDAKAVMQNYSNGDLVLDGTGVLYRGKPLHGVDVDRVLAFQRDGLPYQPIANYINRCRKNTSQRAIQELYPWLEHRQITLTPAGKFIGYKGVMNDFYSVYGNTETIVLQGQVDSEGRILNEVGNIIEVDRSCVSDDFRNGCGPGLHVGALSYAVGWGQRLILVEVDPSDVVSIPTDCDCQKLRCCKYRVVGEYTGPLPDTLTTEFSENTEQGEGDEEDFDELEPQEDSMPYLHTNMNNLMAEISLMSHGKATNQDGKVVQECPKCHGFDCTCKSVVNDLEKIAQDAGILSNKECPDDQVDGGVPDDSDNEEYYVRGMKDGITDKMKNVGSRYLSGDERGADSQRHAAYVEGYIDGYAD